MLTYLKVVLLENTNLVPFKISIWFMENWQRLHLLLRDILDVDSDLVNSNGI